MLGYSTFLQFSGNVNNKFNNSLVQIKTVIISDNIDIILLTIFVSVIYGLVLVAMSTLCYPDQCEKSVYYEDPN